MKVVRDSWSRVEAFLAANPQGLLVVLGPTASGKTAFSVELALLIWEMLGKEVEIISVDSRQIYRGCDVSSAKITTEEMRGIVHHGLDLIGLDQEYSVKDWQDYCFEKIKEIQERGNVVLLCGGTMLWLDAVTENYDFSETIGEKSQRKNPSGWPSLKIGLHWERDQLYERINQRAVGMFESGLIEETKFIQEQNICASALTSFGYQEVLQYLAEEITLTQALELNQQRNRNYAKRQLTWWRGREDVEWFDMSR